MVLTRGGLYPDGAVGNHNNGGLHQDGTADTFDEPVQP